ncbi:hypothetical protein V3F56_08430 [Moorellaceae bacterium AZ2]
MTHTLHRVGTKDNLRHDYVVFAMAAQDINREGAAEKLRKFLEILLKYNPVNFGDMKTGNVISVGRDKVMAGIQDNSIVHGVFTDVETVAKLLNELREADLGMSVVVSGLLESVDDCCRKAGLQRHTVEYSLGVWGKVDRLPEREVLEISTMCGHGMVSFNLVKYMVEQVEKGRLSPKAAARQLAANCHCGVLNPERAAELLAKMANKEE